METLIEGCSVVAYSGHLMVLPTLLRLVRKSSWYFLALVLYLNEAFDFFLTDPFCHPM